MAILALRNVECTIDGDGENPSRSISCELGAVIAVKYRSVTDCFKSIQRYRQEIGARYETEVKSRFHSQDQEKCNDKIETN